MAAESVTPWTYPVWFLTDEAGNKPEASSLFYVTYETMHLASFNIKWVTPKECLRIRKKQTKMFVMNSFSGPVFNHLVSLRCRIMGPLCLYNCMRDGMVFPRRDHPVYSISMKNVVVCCTKLSPSERAEIHQKVEFMCGAYSEDLTKDVTHLISGEVGSKKYHVAANFGLPILQPEWIQEVWDNSQHKLIHGRALSYNRFRCLIFKGLTISVSQLCEEDRGFVKEVVEEEGGCYTASLVPDETTHLILLEPKGEKYEYAKKWQLFCVHEDWFYNSLEAGYCMDEKLYPPKSAETSQPPELQPKVKAPKLQTKTKAPKLQSKVKAPKPKVKVPKPKVKAPKLQPKAKAPEFKTKANASELKAIDCSGLEESMQLNAATSITFQSPTKKEIPSLEILDSFKLSSLPKCDDFLDVCKIFLSDFKDSHMKKLCKIVNAGGGNRFSKYNDCITHVICGKKNRKLIELIKAGSNKPHVVSFDWLLECYKEERLVDETPFSCMEVLPLTPHNEMPCEGENVKCRESNCAEPQSPKPLLDMDDIMNQYIPT